MKPGFAEPMLELLQVAADGRPDVRVEGGRARSLVLSEDGEDLRGEARVDPCIPKGLPDRPLVGRVEEGEQQAHGSGFRVEGSHRLHDAADLSGREVSDDLPGGTDPLGDLDHQVARHEGRRTVRRQVVELRPVLSSDLEDVAEALGHDQRGLRSPSLEHGVRGHGRSVHEPRDRRQADARRRHPLEHALRLVAGRRRDFRSAKPALPEDDDVGERPSDIDPDLVTPHTSRRSLAQRVSS